MRRACIDNSMVGINLVEDARKRFGTYKVEPINFTLAVKEQLAYPLKSGFEDRTVRIRDDPKIIASHRAVRKETTLSGNVRFVAESTAAGHADDFWAHALAFSQPKHPPPAQSRRKRWRGSVTVAELARCWRRRGRCLRQCRFGQGWAISRARTADSSGKYRLQRLHVA